MATDDRMIEVKGVGLAIAADALGALLRQSGDEIAVELRLDQLEVRVSQAALNAVLAALAPVRATLVPGAVSVRLSGEAPPLAVSVPVRQLSVVVGDGELRLRGE